MGLPSMLRAVYGLFAGIMAWGIPLRKKRKESPLLQLPVELIHRISNELSPSSRLILSQTCRPLREILGKDVSLIRFTRQDRCEFLAAIARQLPDRWVCEACIGLHGVITVDTPETPCSITCLAGRERWRYTGYGQRDRLDSRLLRIDHRHIQLALKYTRLQCYRYQQYLNQLIAPHINPSFETHPWPYKQPNKLAVRYSAYPKIVMGHDGNLRFILLSTWCYQEDGSPLSLPAMGDLKICPHLRLMYGLGKGVGHDLGSLRGILRPYLLHGGRHRTKGYYYCCYCPTDLRITKSPGRIELHAWQDLGPEGSPLDKSWRVHIHLVAARGLPYLSHEPGSVWELYQTG
ncbi:hypothetical protein F5Y02DRAFT_311873 [Annulohypoxylon stygium]|nr:hypothetical protein F5Y02DRAFT_311873 [Annulohypoxylon stygium]